MAVHVAPPNEPHQAPQLGAGSTPAESFVRDDIGVQLAIGLLTIVLLVAGLGAWAGSANLAGAVIAPGTVVVDSNVKKVQHPTGGVVGEIRVKEGDKVSAGDLLVRLDETVTRANLGMVVAQLDELAVRQARLKAERDGADGVETPLQLKARENEPEIAEILYGERVLFESRRTARAGKKAQLRERIAQLNEEISGFEAQRSAKSSELQFIKQELAEVEKLWAEKLVSLEKVIATRRDAARVEGERAQLIAATAEARGKITETELQIIEIDQDMRTEVMKDLREAQAKEAELNERRVAAEDQLKRVDIKAPQSGIVDQLAVHTVGGVVNQGEPLMLIVPEGDALVIEAKVAPQDIDHVHVGQAARVRFTAFDQRTTPEFNGEVSRISADVIKEQQTNQEYYIARIALPEPELKHMASLKLVPGMPAEAFIKTSERTAMSYLLKPLKDQIAKAFVER